MSKLHIYRNMGSQIIKVADGDGELSSKDEFKVAITWGAVLKGQTYEIRQGQSPSGYLYDCKAGANKGESARFKQVAREFALQYEEQLGTTLALQAARLAAQKTVTISIASEDLKLLKKSNFKLCFAKKVGTAAYNVVWQSYVKYLTDNQFSWTPEYQLFGSNVFQDNITVRVSTNKVTIGLGEQSTLDEEGLLGNPSTGGEQTAITMVNNYGTIHPGLNQLSTGVDGTQISTPIYVAQEPIVEGNVALTPVEKVLVWFEQNIETSTMFSSARSRQVEIDLTNTNEQTRLYTNQQWITPSL